MLTQVLRKLSLYLLSIGLLVAGAMHFTNDADLASITPLPFALEIVWITGIMEFLFALFLLIPKYRGVTGLWLCLFFLAVLPANINMAINNLPMFGAQVDPLMLWGRIPMQFVIIGWVLFAAESIPLIRQYGWGSLRCQTL